MYEMWNAQILLFTLEKELKKNNIKNYIIETNNIEFFNFFFQFF